MELTNKLAFTRQKVKKIEIDGDVAYIRVLSGTQRDDWNAYVNSLQENDERNNDDVFAYMLVRSLCDTSGKQIFDEAEISELSGSLDAKTMNELFIASIEFNRIGKDADEAAKKN